MDKNATREQAFALIDLDDINPEDWGIKFPFIETKFINKIYKAVRKMRVKLDEDPLGHGPRRLNKKISATRNYLDVCDEFSTTITQNLAFWKRHLREESATFDLKKKWMVANDPQIRAGRSTTDRDALAHMVMVDQAKLIKKLEGQVEDLEMVLSVVRTKRTDLKDTQQQIKSQIKLCFEEIRLGSQWGPYLAGQERELSPSPGVDSILDTVNKELQNEHQKYFEDMDEEIDLEDILGGSAENSPKGGSGGAE
jgi:hypothetical protein